MDVVAGTQFTATLADPGGLTFGVGARVEVPGTRAIVSAYSAATLNVDTWSVTLDAPLTPGDYELVWLDPTADPSFESFFPLRCVSAGDMASGNLPDIDQAAVRPTVDEIAKLERTRTRNPDTGQDQGTFNAQTWPTDTDVNSLIDDALQEILTRLPEQMDPELYPQIKEAIKLQAAIMVETSFFRVEQGSTGNAVYTYERMLVGLMDRLTPTDYRYAGLF